MSRIVFVVVLIGALASAACSTETAKREALARGNGYYAESRFNEAIIEYRRAVQLDPQWGEARRRLAEAYLKVNNLRNAMGELIRASDLTPDDSELQLLVGNFLLAGGGFEDARSRADHVLKREPMNAAAHVLRGNALVGLKEFGGALDEMELALADDPNRALTLASIGVVQLVRGDKPGAADAFAKAVEADPRSPLIRLASASYLLTVGKVADAERQLKESYALGPKHPAVNRALAAFYIRTGRAAEAEPYLKQLSEVSGDDGVKFSLARLYLATKRRDEAVQLLRTLEVQKETALEAKVQLAALLYGGAPAQAHQLLDEALNISPKDPRTLLLRASFLLDEGKASEAIAAARTAIEGDFTLAQAYFVLGHAHLSLRQTEDAVKAFNEVVRLQPLAIQAQLALSSLYLDSGNLNLAQELAGSAALIAPRAPAVREAIIRASLAQGNLIRAETETKALIAENPRRANGYVLQGDLRVAQKNIAAAERAFQRALELAPQSTAATVGLIRTDMVRGRRAAALARVDRIIEAGPKNAENLLLAARTFVTLNEWQKAEDTFRRALEVDPLSNEAYSRLGSLYMLQGKLDGALKEFQSAAAKDPMSVVAHTMTGIIFERQSRRADAKDAYRRALASASSADVAANNLAWLLAQDNESLDEALQLAQKARVAMPDSPDVTDTIGWIYYQRGLHSQAIEEFKAAVRRQPKSAPFNYHLGLAYAKNGDQQLARQTLEAALQMDPKAAEASEARAALAQLKGSL